MVTITRKALEKSLAGINQSIKRSTPDPLLGTLVKDTLHFYQEGYLSVWANVVVDQPESESLEPYIFSVDSGDFHSVVAAMATEDIDVKINEKSLTVKSGQSSVRIPYVDGFGTSAAERPVFETVVELPSSFITSINKARRFVAKTEDRPSLSCIYVRIDKGQIALLATDAFRMYVTYFKDVVIDPSISIDILIPERCADSMTKIFTGNSVRLGVTEKQHIIMSSVDKDIFVLTPGFNERYPSAVFSILKDPGKPCFMVDRDKFIEAIRLGNSFSAGDKLTIHNVDGEIRLTFNDSRMDSDLHIEGIENMQSFTEATFNPRFLLDCLQSLDKKIYINQQSEGEGPLRMSSDDNTTTIVHKISV